jgi:hypothetical protein
MTLLVGLMNLGGRVFWQVTQADDPGVLTMAFPEQIAKNSEVPDVSPPEIDRGEWTIDFDAVREHLDPRAADYLPAWARGRVGAAPSETGGQVRFDLTPEMFG